MLSELLVSLRCEWHCDLSMGSRLRGNDVQEPTLNGGITYNNLQNCAFVSVRVTRS
jgi:hypothetical protein